MPISITLYGADSCRYTNRARGQLDSFGIQYAFVDVDQDIAHESSPRRVNAKRQIPTVEIECDGSTRKLVRPNDWQLETELLQCGLLKERPRRPESRTVIRGPRGILGDRR